MRFGLDGIPLAETKTGIGHYTFELAQALAAFAPADEFEIVSPFSEASAPDQPLPSNLRFVSVAANGWKRRLWWSITLPRYCADAGVSLFHGTNFELPYWSRCPTVLTIHDLSLMLFPHTHEKRLVRRARLKLPRVARKADAIVTPSETVKGEVCEHLGIAPAKVFAIPEAARRSFYPASQAESAAVLERLRVEDDFVLFVGTIEPRKNVLNLVRAFAELVRDNSLRLQLVIAGKPGWLSHDLDDYLAGSAIRERVVFTGHVSDDELRALYSSCRVFVYPSLYEGFGLPLLEAMACGAPVVTSNVPSIVETVGNAARPVSPHDVHDIAQGVKSLIENDAEREHWAAAGKRHAEKFSWERTASATLDVYRKVLRGRR
jgi:glycosyltransferase involved in cell wall biosynthesis